MKQIAGFLSFLFVVMRQVPGLCKDWSDLARWGRAATGCSTCLTPQQILPAQVEVSWKVHLCHSGSTWFVQGPMRPDPGIEWESRLRGKTMVSSDSPLAGQWCCSLRWCAVRTWVPVINT